MILGHINIKNVEFMAAWLRDIKANPEKWTDYKFLAQSSDNWVMVVELVPKYFIKQMKQIEFDTFERVPTRITVDSLISLSLIKLSAKDEEPFDFYNFIARTRRGYNCPVDEGE